MLTPFEPLAIDGQELVDAFKAFDAFHGREIMGLPDSGGEVMAERSHYLDILLREPTIGHQLHARLLLAAHARTSTAMRSPSRGRTGARLRANSGLMFRVFGEPSSLANYAQRLLFSLNAA